jgi:hypothetical protein
MLMLMPARTLVNIICSVSSSLLDAGSSELKAEGWSGLYANLCTQTKKYLDDKNTVPHARETLLKFHDELPMAKEYWDVTQDDFPWRTWCEKERQWDCGRVLSVRWSTSQED